MEIDAAGGDKMFVIFDMIAHCISVTVQDSPIIAANVLTVSLDYRGTCDCFYSLICIWSVDG